MKTGTVFERIKYYYDKGLYTETHLQKFLEKNVITEDEYISIDEQLKIFLSFE